MIDTISKFLTEVLGAEFGVLVCSMVPIIELRGAVPLACFLGFPWWKAFIISVIGNFIPVPFILLFIRAILEWMKKIKGLSKIALWVEKKAEKNKEKVEKYSFWGLFAFVAIPLPGTGAWTGSLVAALLHTKFTKALAAVTLGILAAGVIVTLISYGVLGFLSFLV